MSTELKAFNGSEFPSCDNCPYGLSDSEVKKCWRDCGDKPNECYDCENALVYLKTDVDKVIKKKDAEIANLKGKTSGTKPVNKKGAELFDTYLEAKKVLVDRIRDVLEIMARCKMLDVVPSDATNYVAQKVKDVANHQWQYNSGHETIYCQHAYSFRHGIEKCTVKIPVKYLGMTNDEIYAANRDAAIASLEQAKEDLDDELNRVTEPINKKKAKLDEKIAALREGKLE